MYELIILALLSRRPQHGYLIAKIINTLIGPYTKLSNGQLYPLLAKLQKEGFIELVVEDQQAVAKPDKRPVQSYRITELGSQNLYKLLLDVTSNPGDYQRIFTFKVGMMDLIPFKDRIKLIEHYINYCQNQLFHIKTEKQNMEDNSYVAPLVRVVGMMAHRLKQWELELAWANQLYQEEVALHEREISPPASAENQ